MAFMLAQFDIFRIERGGQVRWLEAVESLESAKARIETFGQGQYVIVDEKTGRKIVINGGPQTGSVQRNQGKCPDVA